MTIRNYSNTTTEGSLTTSITTTDTTVALTSFSGYPAVPFTASIDRGNSSEEVVLVTALAGTNATVTRGFNGTSPKAHAAGSSFVHVTIALDYTEANGHVNATSGVHGTTGALVGTTGVQTLTNKTLISPTLSSPTITGGTWTSPTFTSPTLSAPAITGGTQASPTITTPTITTPAIKDANGASVNYRWVQLTQAAYTALATKDPATLYVVVG